LRSGRPRVPEKTFKNMEASPPHRFEGFPGPPGPARLQKRRRTCRRHPPPIISVANFERSLELTKRRYSMGAASCRCPLGICTKEQPQTVENSCGATFDGPAKYGRSWLACALPSGCITLRPRRLGTWTFVSKMCPGGSTQGVRGEERTRHSL
jgi:hypothetical protein